MGDQSSTGRPNDGYAIFEGNGMRIDLASFFKTEAGKMALSKASASAFPTKPKKDRK